MIESEALATANKIIQAVFGRENPYSLKELEQKFAFDVNLPQVVHDSKTGEPTYTSMPNSRSFITMQNSEDWEEDGDWMRPPRPLESLPEVIKAWQEINYITTDRAYQSENVHASDPIYGSRNVYYSTNCGQCENILFCDNTYHSTFCMACQRSGETNFCIRTDDSNTCTNSYSVICSNKISNSLFIQDCASLHECLFCSHIAHHEYCVANMQYDKADYLKLKQQIINWIFAS